MDKETKKLLIEIAVAIGTGILTLYLFYKYIDINIDKKITEAQSKPQMLTESLTLSQWKPLSDNEISNIRKLIKNHIYPDIRIVSEP